MRKNTVQENDDLGGIFKVSGVDLQEGFCCKQVSLAEKKKND